MFNYWNESDLIALDSCLSFDEIGKIAFSIQIKMPEGLGQVCGPISTGGEGNIKDNMKIFSDTINVLINENILLFDQRPLEASINRIRKNLGENYSYIDLLNSIYAPLFNSRKVVRAYFIHGWESSKGSVWEHDVCVTNNIDIIYLPKGFEKNGFLI
jgi:hypothetical protein